MPQRDAAVFTKVFKHRSNPETQNKMQKVSLVIPVYNEAGLIDSLVRSYYNRVIKKIPKSELIVAEDGSSDGTKEILIKLKKDVPFRLVSGKERKGYNKAVKDALRIPKNDIILFSDSSGQHNPADFFKMAKYIDDYDMVIGYKYLRKDPTWRVFFSRIYNFLIKIFFGFDVRDINCGFRIIKKKVIDDVLKETGTFKKYCVFSEFTLRAYKKGYKIKEVPIHHEWRTVGEKKSFSLWNILKVVLILVLDIVRLRIVLGKK